MHSAITELAKNTLEQSKTLIKAMDAAWFSYDRKGLLENLVALKQLHDQKASQKVIEKIEHIIKHIEDVEHRFEDWQTQKTKESYVVEMNTALHSLLVWVTDPKNKPTRNVLLGGWMKRLEIMMFIVLLVLGGSLLLYWWTELFWYTLIWLCLWTMGCFLLARAIH